jgi:hypothetical protein
MFLTPGARTRHAVSRCNHTPASTDRPAVAVAAAAAAAAAAAGRSITAPDLDPQVYLDPAANPTPFVGPVAVKHIPGELKVKPDTSLLPIVQLADRLAEAAC